MAKIVLDNINSGFNLQKINNNFDKVEAALNNQVYYRDNPLGEPNTLLTNLDANGRAIYNLPAPSVPSQAARLQDVQNAIGNQAAANLTIFNPTADISSTNVQAAIEEVRSDSFSALGTFSSSLLGNLGSSFIGFIQSGTGAIYRTVMARLRDTVHLTDFASPGSDCTSGLRAAIVECMARNKRLFVPAGDWLFSETITFPANFPGVVGEGVYRSSFFYTGTGSGFYADGVGTLGIYRDWSMVAGGVIESDASRRSVVRNGFDFKCRGGNGELTNLTFYGFNGAGFKVTDLWDSHVNNVVTLLCGNATEYAWGAVNGTDITNHSTFIRCQSELSYGRAFKIEGLNNVVIELHSERTQGNGVDFTHVFLGDITIISGRIEDLTGVRVLMGIAVGRVEGLKIVGYVQCNWAARLGPPAIISGCNWSALEIPASNLRHLRFVGCNFQQIDSAYPEKETIFESCTTSGGISLVGNNVVMRFINSRCESLVATAGGNNTVIAEGGYFENFPNSLIVELRNCRVNQGVATQFAQNVLVNGCYFNSFVDIASSNVRWVSDGNTYQDLRMSGGAPSWNFGPNDRCRGLINPVFLTTPFPSGFPAISGDRTYRLKGTIGQPAYWTFEDGGTWRAGPAL